jgi:four helix bundle protein
MTYEEWEQTVPQQIRLDSVWKITAYRKALFLSDLVWADAQKFLRNKLTTSIADQITRAAGKIGSSISEGYSRGSGKSRALFYEYALGSARETRDWYYQGRRVLSKRVYVHRLDLCTDLLKLLLAMIVTERKTARRVILKQAIAAE